MQQNNRLAETFEEQRGHLRAVAYRMLGSLSEADDAIQEAWLRLSRTDATAIENLGAWLTTVVSRVCLDILRSRTSRKEESLSEPASESAAQDKKTDPEQEAVLADSVGLALLVVLDRLTPSERLAFVLHDIFAIPFEEIAPIIDRTPAAARQLASRARRRIQGTSSLPDTSLTQQRHLVSSFLTALRNGDVEGLVALLDPSIAVCADQTISLPAETTGIQSAEQWAKQAMSLARGARFARPALIDGEIGVVIAPRGRLFRVLRFTFVEGRIAQVNIIGDPESLGKLELGIVEN